MTFHSPIPNMHDITDNGEGKGRSTAFAVAISALAVAALGNGAVLVLGTGVLLAQTALSVLQMMPVGAFRRRAELRTPRHSARIYSVHVATHDEPADVVIRTVAALAAQKNAPEHEIIVLDNNTSDPALWQPVERYCRNVPGVTFRHFDGVKGAKAGALALAREMTRLDATHVVTVDADYVAAPDFLATADLVLDETSADFVQFPQAYVHAATAPGVSGELADYFRRFARHGSLFGEALLTGTLSVISLKALDAVGGWRADTVTEDAELGSRLVRAGFRGIFSPRIAGRGLLPLSAESLCTQRRRWAHGNAATLMMHGRGLRSVAALRQLSAWLNLQAVGALLLLWGLVSSVFRLPHADAIAMIGAIVTLMPIISATVPIGLSRSRSALCRIALLPSSAQATLEAALGVELAFARTPKRPGDTKLRMSLEVVVSLIMGILAAVLAVAVDDALSVVAAVALCLPSLTYAVLARELERYSHQLERIGS